MHAEERLKQIGACWSLGNYEEAAAHLMPAAEAVAAAQPNAADESKHMMDALEQHLVS
jgi:hypothetical protein